MLSYRELDVKKKNYACVLSPPSHKNIYFWKNSSLWKKNLKKSRRFIFTSYRYPNFLFFEQAISKLGISTEAAPNFWVLKKKDFAKLMTNSISEACFWASFLNNFLLFCSGRSPNCAIFALSFFIPTPPPLLILHPPPFYISLSPYCFYHFFFSPFTSIVKIFGRRRRSCHSPSQQDIFCLGVCWVYGGRAAECKKKSVIHKKQVFCRPSNFRDPPPTQHTRAPASPMWEKRIFCCGRISTTKGE